MEDQIRNLENARFTDKEDVEIIRQVMNGNYVPVYASPECLVSAES